MAKQITRSGILFLAALFPALAFAAEVPPPALGPQGSGVDVVAIFRDAQFVLINPDAAQGRRPKVRARVLLSSVPVLMDNFMGHHVFPVDEAWHEYEQRRRERLSGVPAFPVMPPVQVAVH